MPPRMEIKTKLTAKSERVKSVDLHPTEPWVLTSLYSGHVAIWNYKTGQLVKTFEVTEVPVRAARFIARKQWFACGADDLQLRVYDYNTMEKVKALEAHADYIRSIAVHPSQPLVLTSGDDLAVKVWDWERNWTCTQIYEGHAHYVMQVVFNPKDPNTFATCSLDRTVKVWSLGSPVPNFTLEGHDKGVNCVDYFPGGDKPYLISGADDRTARVWDYQARTCVSVLEGHTNNISAVAFHPTLPIIITGSEDGTVRLWHADTYRLESTVTYGLERVWAITCLKGSNKIAVGFDEGTMVLKMGSSRPVMSMDSAGRIVWTRGPDVFTANVRAADAPDGERLPLAVKELGSCEKPPQQLRHSPNGRFVAAIAEGEFVIYTALAWRNRTFGSGEDLVWSADSNRFAVRDWGRKVRIFQNFEEKTSLTPPFSVEAIFGGALLGVRGRDCLVFYDWETLTVVRRIDDVAPSKVYWADGGELVALVCESMLYVLRYNTQHGPERDDAGFEDAIEVDAEIPDDVRSGTWVGECFIYSTTADRLRYCVGGHSFTAGHLDRPMYVLGYSQRDGRAILSDKDVGVIGITLQHELLAYMTAVVRGDHQAAATLLPAVPKEHRNRIARFLDAQGMKEEALAVSIDSDMKFDLAVQLHRLDIAKEIAVEADTESKWRQLGDLALQACDLPLAESCFLSSHDYSGLLLLYSATGNMEGMAKLAESARAAGRANIAFTCYFTLREIDKCIDLLVDAGRAPEAAFLARTYAPSRITEIVKIWRESLIKVNPRAAEAIADPTDYANLFPDIQLALDAEKHFVRTNAGPFPASSYLERRGDTSLDVIQFMREEGVTAEENGDVEAVSNHHADHVEDEAEDEQQVAAQRAPSPVASPAAVAPESPVTPAVEAPPAIVVPSPPASPAQEQLPSSPAQAVSSPQAPSLPSQSPSPPSQSPSPGSAQASPAPRGGIPAPGIPTPGSQPRASVMPGLSTPPARSTPVQSHDWPSADEDDV